MYIPKKQPTSLNIYVNKQKRREFPFSAKRCFCSVLLNKGFPMHWVHLGESTISKNLLNFVNIIS